jgi:hypothetical protein
MGSTRPRRTRRRRLLRFTIETTALAAAIIIGTLA